MTKSCPPPNPAKPPKLKVPAGACDTHIHVIGPYDRYPKAPQIADDCPEAPAPMMRDFLRVMGLTRAVIVHVTFAGTRPDVTLDAIAEMSGDARGVVILDPDATEAEMRRLTDGGIRGARLTPQFGEQADVEAVVSLAEKIAPFGWHMLFMPSGPEQWLDLAPLLGRLPVDVVLDHMAWRGWRVEDGLDQPGFRALRDLADTGQVWIKLGGMYRSSRQPAPWSDLNPFAEALIEARPDRIIWCSDWPHVRMWDKPMPDDDALLDWLGQLAISEAMIRTILVDNPAALYGFD
jgi:2-pyrone-4,6-dicarboxylate lactonase